MSRELPKAYDPSAIEKKWAEYWVKERLFDVATPAKKPERAFTLLLPPPNVTGNLHMGHMLNHTEMDIIVRWHRMLGRSEEHTSELQSRFDLVCRLLLEKKKNN